PGHARVANGPSAVAATMETKNARRCIQLTPPGTECFPVPASSFGQAPSSAKTILATILAWCRSLERPLQVDLSRPIVFTRMAVFGAEQKLTFWIACFRFWPHSGHCAAGAVEPCETVYGAAVGPDPTIMRGNRQS